MASAAVKWAMVAAAAIAIGGTPVAMAPQALADPQCEDPAMCQARPQQQEACNSGLNSTVCSRPGDVELRSQPNPNFMPPIQSAEVPPWMVLNAPGEGRYP